MNLLCSLGLHRYGEVQHYGRGLAFEKWSNAKYCQRCLKRVITWSGREELAKQHDYR